MKKLASFMLLLFLITLPHVLRAAPRSAEERREYYQRGRDALAAKNWEEAVRIFEQLWAEQHSYDVALSLGEAEFRLDEYRNAAEYLSFAAANMPASEKADLVQRTLKALERAKQEVGALTLIVDQPGASVQLDGKPLGRTPLPPIIFVDPGHHSIETTLSQFRPARIDLDIGRGDARTVILKLDPVVAAVASSQAPPSINSSRSPSSAPLPAARGAGHGKAIALITGGAITAIALTTSVVFAVKRSSAAKGAKAIAAAIPGGASACNRAEAPAACGELKRRYDDRNSDSRAVNIAIPVAVVAAAGTAVIYLAWPHKKVSGAWYWPVTPLIGQGTAGVLMSGRF
jgi:hypothetical protein